MDEPYILKMTPYLRPKVWGGRKLATTFHKSLPDDRPYGEAWEVSDLDEGESVIANGPLTGKPLSEAVDRWGEALAPPAADGAFPLLVKILDADDDLSVQVHPGADDLARHDLDGDSKDECWVVLDCEPGGSILHGFDEPVSPSDFRAAIAHERAAQMLRRIEVSPGDVIRVRPGTIHAICKGVCLLEIQQPSDTTYRVYDYGRPGMDGKPRELHVDEALLVSNFGPHPPARLEAQPSPVRASVEVLADTPAYRIERVSVDDSLEWTVDAATPQVVFCLNGAARLRASTGDVELSSAQTAVIPAGIGAVELTVDTPDAEFIVAGMGGSPLVV